MPMEEVGHRATPRTVLVIHAHPDDEVFATGAATLAAKDAGNQVFLRILTGGEGRSADLSAAGLREARRHRALRLDQSAQLLGIDAWAPIEEGRWNDTPHAPERTLAAAPLDDITAAVVNAIEQVAPSTVLTVGSQGLTGHPDHMACHRAVTAAVKQIDAPGLECLGAVLSGEDLAAAQHMARKLLGTAIGSGRTVGSDTSQSMRLNGPPDTEARRRGALDVYAEGLGTSAIEHLRGTVDPRSDSLLMRLVLDHRGWDYDLVDAVSQPAPTFRPDGR